MQTKTIMVSPQMEQIVKDLAMQHDMNWSQIDAWLTLAMPGHAERWLFINLDGERFSVTWYLVEPNGTLTPEVDMVFTMHAIGWEPIELLYSNEAFARFLQHAYAAHLPVYDAEGNLYFDTFTEYWAEQLKVQGWTDYGQPLAEEESCRRMVGCQSTNHTFCYGELWQCAACGKTVCCNEGSDDHPELCDDCWAVLFAPSNEVTLTQSGALQLICDCPQKCGTVLKLAHDGFLIVEDRDGLRVSIMLPTWLEQAIHQAVQQHWWLAQLLTQFGIETNNSEDDGVPF